MKNRAVSPTRSYLRDRQRKRSITSGLTVASRIRSRDVTRVRADDELAGAKIHVRIGHRGELVTERGQSVAQVGRGIRFHVERNAGADLPSRRVEHSLWIGAVV